MMNFEQALQHQLDTNAKFAKSLKGKRLQKVLKLDPSDHRREKVLARLEDNARVNIGQSLTAPVDWSDTAIDWTTLLQILIAVLPFILALFGL